MTEHRPSEAPGKWIGKILQIEIDRQLGRAHPRFPSLIYPVNYGFVPGTLAADGHEVDAYILGVGEPLRRFRGECIAIVRRVDDAEDKLIVVPIGMRLTAEEITHAIAFQEQFFQSELLRG